MSFLRRVSSLITSSNHPQHPANAVAADGASGEDNKDKESEVVHEELLGDDETPPSVFISFAAQDELFVAYLRDELIREKHVVNVDLELKSDAATATTNINNSDVFLYVLSPDSSGNVVCRTELEAANKVGKRVVPVVCRDVDYAAADPSIATLQWVFFPNKTAQAFTEDEESEFADGIRLLKKSLLLDAAHLRVHTKLLTRALQYESTKSQPLLLQGRDRQRAQQWLYDSAMGKTPRPTSIHMSYIVDSLGIVTNIELDGKEKKEVPVHADDTELAAIYVGYVRNDKPFATKLVNKFCAHVGQKRLIWVDWEPVPELPSQQWVKNVHRGIEAADAFLCVLSSAAIASEVWHWEVDHAMKCNKRIIILVLEEVDFRQLRGDLVARSSQWLFFRQDDDFDDAFKLMLAQLDANLPHLHYHTRLLNLAVSWDDKSRDKTLLLSPNETQRAQDWLLRCALGTEPRPSALILAYLQASQQALEKCVIL